MPIVAKGRDIAWESDIKLPEVGGVYSGGKIIGVATFQLRARLGELCWWVGVNCAVVEFLKFSC